MSGCLCSRRDANIGNTKRSISGTTQSALRVTAGFRHPVAFAPENVARRGSTDVLFDPKHVDFAPKHFELNPDGKEFFKLRI